MNFMVKLSIIFGVFMATFPVKAEIDCSGEGKYEFGTKFMGKYQNQAAPFIAGRPQGLCELKEGESDKIARTFLENAKATSGRPIVVITMGAPGSGKSSSLAKVLSVLGHEKSDFVNVDRDDIKTHIADFKRAISIPSAACPQKLRAYSGVTKWCAQAGSIIAKKILSKSLMTKRSFILDGTCSSPKYCKSILDKAVKAGFVAYVVAVYTDVETCVERAKERSFHQGRWTQPHYVREEHQEISDSNSFMLLKKLALKSGGNAWIFDNNGSAPRQVYEALGDKGCEDNDVDEACSYYKVK